MTRLLSYYGDDFTGSTDVMEALATHGIDTVLFTRLPGPAEFAPFASYRCHWPCRNQPQRDARVDGARRFRPSSPG